MVTGMNWFPKFVLSSLGKKITMAITGLGFCGFLAAHLAGNLTLYGGKAFFNSYAGHLHSLGPLLTLAEFGLLFFAIVHVLTGATLFYQNLRARPTRYAVNHRAGGRTIGSATMPYTGLLLLFFVIFHLLNFSFADKTDRTVFDVVAGAFARPDYIALYIAAMIVADVHVSHGFWSAFQTIGAGHPKYTPIIKGLSIVFSLIVAIGFGSLPIYISIISN